MGDWILAAVILKSGESGESEALQAMEEALRQAGLKLEDMKSVVSTGCRSTFMHLPGDGKQCHMECLMCHIDHTL
jgi:hypothetical protein